MGGRSDDGIMSVRRGYQEGGDVGFFQGIINALNPTSGEIIERIQKEKKKNLLRKFYLVLVINL